MTSYSSIENCLKCRMDREVGLEIRNLEMRSQLVPVSWSAFTSKLVSVSVTENLKLLNSHTIRIFGNKSRLFICMSPGVNAQYRYRENVL